MKQRSIPFCRATIDKEEISEVVETLRSGWLTTGPKCERFEKKFADIIGCKTAIALSSCTAALHLALIASGVGEGDEVITSPYTFASTAEVINYVGAIPVFSDVTLDYNIDVIEIQKKISPKTRAIIPVHFGGLPCDMDEIMKLASTYNLSIIEDAAHAFPAEYKDKMIGNIGDFTCFSFYATKNITTAEGGMITTNKIESENIIRALSLHGIDKDIWKREIDGSYSYYDIIAAGYKYNLSDISASIGIHQLEKLNYFMERRRSIVERYNAAFSEISDIILPPVGDKDKKHAWHLYVIRLLEPEKRDDVIVRLRERGISTSVHFFPLHMNRYYREKYRYTDNTFPIARDLYRSSISIPLYPLLTDDDVDYIIEKVIESVLI
ncbi:MAG: DegT/DnrJ/EryC1/StrS family aminotransferase [Spirochaetota bacterium]|nr:DegT/DnrJ/EryC1/StrS family aminotransferase [Spirochaetota bacterium]